MILGLLSELIDLGVGVFGLVVFAVLALSGEIGFRIGRGRARAATSLDRESAGVSTLTTGMLGLLAFTLALTIDLAQDRFEARRHATLDEANTIGTAWLRTQLAGASGKPIAALIEEYARGRLDYLVAVNPNTADEALARTNALQAAIWQRSLTVLAGMPPTLAPALIASLNDMFDASLVQRYAMPRPCTDRDYADVARWRHAGGRRARLSDGLSGRRQLILALLLLLMVSSAMALIIDFNRPRLGFTQINPAPLVWTIHGFAPAPLR